MSTTAEKNSTINDTATLESNDEFVTNEEVSSTNNNSPPTYPLASLSSNALPSPQYTSNGCNYAPINSCGSCPATPPCYCAAPKPACLCIPRPVPICPIPPVLVCPPPACPKPVTCPPCLQPLPCIQASRPIPQNDCCCNCNRPCANRRSKFAHAMHGVRTNVANEMEQRAAKCNNTKLRQIISEHISLDADEAKRRIQFAAQQEFGGPINVICGSGEFSYLVHAQHYCQHSYYQMTCYAYQ
ncbi:Ground-like domain-containing protein [Aphelenchoides besseyi]|nr:Ground-like domain-containing protein [Aphelenchoides besseyi]